MKIVIAGYGFVGQAVEKALNRHPSVRTFIDDPAKGFDAKEYALKNAMNPDWDGVVVCVATPQDDDGSCYTKNVQDVFEKYGDTKYLIKSAVDPKFLCNWAINSGSYTYSPEFLRGSNVNANPTQEFLSQTFTIYGGDDCRWWDEIFRTVLPVEQVRYLDLHQAAFAKYVENTFFATKVTFFNEMYHLYEAMCDELGIPEVGFDAMVEAITLDPRIGRSHTQVPGPDGEFGFGGHCLPKDLNAFRKMTNCRTPLLDAVADLNEEIRKDVGIS
jgi:UDPglucose 6-dehydrogenase